MPDREKVIMGLEHCGFNEKRGCVGCPYSDECGDFGRDAGMSSLATDALALLREQEPVKPVFDSLDGNVGRWRCGNCQTSLGAVRPPYCWHCGKAVKWDG